MKKQNTRLIVRGGGDLASGVIHRLYRSGYHVLILEGRKPSAIRRRVAFCEAVYDGEAAVEGVVSQMISDMASCEEVWKAGKIPIMTDESGEAIKKMKPDAVIDAILAKKNLGTTKDMALLTIGLGPGFEAGVEIE